MYAELMLALHIISFFLLFFAAAERESAISQAIADAKAHGKKQSLSRLATAQAQGSSKYTSGQMVGRLFKKPTKQAVKQGEARLMYEDMVYRAERRLAEMNRKSAQVQSAEARAEELASELFHKPGSQLTEEELARMWQESGCEEIREEPLCNDPARWVFRSIDGTCNNLQNPLFGASGTPFTRIIPSQYEDGIHSLRGGLQARNSDLLRIGNFVPPYPSARLISQTITSRNVSKEEQPFTHILMQWGQFLDHDMDLSPELEPVPECESCVFTEVCEPIFVPEDDPSFGEGTPQNGDCLRFARSLPACDVSRPGQFLPREQLNDLTSFIDGSQVYGSNEEVAEAVRAFEGGLLRVGENIPGNQPSLPIDTQDIVACPNQVNCFLAGDVRANEQISLTTMHTLWLREHNRIAMRLSEINPFWNDERIFQEARKIVGALIQKITYIDYLPKVLGPTVFNEVIGPFRGYDRRVDPGVANSFATAAYRYGHSLVRPMFTRLGSKYQPLGIGPLNLVDAFFNPSQFRASFGTDPLLRGLVTENANRFDEFVNSVLTTQLFQTDSSPGMDLASLNIQRGRDHGLPPYLTWQRFCSKVFENLYSDTPEFENELTLVHFLQLYGSLDTVDLWIAGLAEERLPGAFFGPTFACIFGITFSNVRDGDRFFYERPVVFSPSQLKEIQRDTLSRVICDNSDGINQIQPDAFLSNQTRVSCDSLPRIDLNQWREEPCFVRVEVMARNVPLLVQVFSRSIRRQFTSFSNQFRASRASEFQCVQVACPTARRRTVVFATTDMRSNILIMPNNDLTPNQLRFNGRYRAGWPRENFAQQRGGVFLTEKDCRRSSQVGLTFSMRGDAQSLNEVQRLELALQQQSGGEDSGDKELEEDLESFFGSDEDDGSVPSQSTGTAEAEEVATDQELSSELEQALQALAQ